MNRAIVFSVDDNYKEPFKVLLWSLVSRGNINRLSNFFVLHTDALSEPSIADILDFACRHGCSLEFRSASPKRFSSLPWSIDDHVSISTYIRLFVASILPENVDSFIYFDSDMLVLSDVSSLLSLELTSVVAAVDHCTPANQLRLWGDTAKSYFQAGLLVGDLAYWRSNELESALLEIAARNREAILWHDQDVLNLFFSGDYQRLPLTFNFCRDVRLCLDIADKQPSLIPKILHYDGRQKPWNCKRIGQYEQLWYETYALALGSRHPLQPNAFDIRGRRLLHSVKTRLRSL